MFLDTIQTNLLSVDKCWCSYQQSMSSIATSLWFVWALSWCSHLDSSEQPFTFLPLGHYMLTFEEPDLVKMQTTASHTACTLKPHMILITPHNNVLTNTQTIVIGPAIVGCKTNDKCIGRNVSSNKYYVFPMDLCNTWQFSQFTTQLDIKIAKTQKLFFLSNNLCARKCNIKHLQFV